MENCDLQLHTETLDLKNLKIYQKIFKFFLNRRLDQYTTWCELGKPLDFKWLSTKNEQGPLFRIKAKYQQIRALPQKDISSLQKHLNEDFKIWRKENVHCHNCSAIVPRDHGVYKLDSWYAKAVSGDMTVFCSKGCGTSWRHSQLSAEQKENYHNKIATTRKNRTPLQKAESAAKMSSSWARIPEAEKQRIIACRNQTTIDRGGYSNIVLKRDATLRERYSDDYGKNATRSI